MAPFDNFTMMNMPLDMSMISAIPRQGAYGPNTDANAHLRTAYLLDRQNRYASRGNYGRGFQPGPLDLSTGAINPSTMDIGQMNALLGQFGQHLPENPATNAIFPSTGFFGNHPRFSAALESGLLGAANTPGGSQTVGEGISAAIRGGLSGPAERARLLNMQYMQPFQAATMVQTLRRGNIEDAEYQARTNLYNQQADYYKERPDLEWTKLQNKQESDAANAAAKLSEAQTRLFQQQSKMDDTHASVFRELGIDPFPTDAKGNIGTPSKEDWARVNALIQARNVQRAGTGASIASGGADARQANSFENSRWHTVMQDRLQHELISGKEDDPMELKRKTGKMNPSQQEIDAYNEQRRTDIMNWAQQGFNAERGQGKPGRPGAQLTPTPQSSNDKAGAAIDNLAKQIQANRSKNQGGGVQPNHFLPTQQQPAPQSQTQAGGLNWLGQLVSSPIPGLVSQQDAIDAMTFWRNQFHRATQGRGVMAPLQNQGTL